MLGQGNSSELLLFLVYNLLHEKFNPKPAEEGEGYIPDHLKENEQKEGFEKEQRMKEYLSVMFPPKMQPRSIPLPPVRQT